MAESFERVRSGEIVAKSWTAASAAKGERIAALDGLRGIAALMVVVRHAITAVEMPVETLRCVGSGPIGWLANASGAVFLFFVISGCVLAPAFERQLTLGGLLQFYVRRIFRIHPPYVAGLLFAWLVSFYYALPGEQGGISEWLWQFERVHITTAQLAGSAVFPGAAGWQVPVGWTLRVEAILSLWLPLMVVLARRIHWSVLIGAGIATLAAGVTGAPQYLFSFGCGVVAFLERGRLQRWLTPSGQRARIWLAGSVVLFVLPLVLEWPPFDERSIALSSVGAFGIVVAAPVMPALRRCLSNPPTQFLGRVSYGLYLVHFPLVLLAAPTVLAAGPPLGVVDRIIAVSAIVAFVLAAGLPLAALCNRFVERPAIAVGARASNALSQWLPDRAFRSPAGGPEGTQPPPPGS